MFFSNRFQHLVPPTRRAPDYAQYQGEVWVAGPPSMMPAVFWGYGRGSVQIGTPGAPPAPLPAQAPNGQWSAPTVPQQVTAPGSTAQVGQPTQPQPVQAYQFLRAPTGLEAMTGPQFNPATLLGLLP